MPIWWPHFDRTPPEVVAEVEREIGPEGTIEVEIDTALAKELHGEDTSATQAWARTALDHLWRSGPKPLLEWLDAAQPTTAASSLPESSKPAFSTGATADRDSSAMTFMRLFR